MKTRLLAICLLLSPLFINAQIEYLERIEIDLKDDVYLKEINPMGDRGMLLLMKDDDTKKGERDWFYDFYNTKLELDKQEKVILDKKLTLIGTIETEEKVVSMYQEVGKTDFQIITYLSENEEVISTKGELPKKTVINSIYLLDDVIFAVGTLKREPVVWRINWNTGIKKVLPISVPAFKLKDLKIMEVQTLGASKEVFLFIKAVENKNDHNTFVIKYDDEGRKKEFYEVKTDEEHQLMSSSASRIDNEEYIFNGTYSTPKSAGSNGLYIGKMKDQKLEFIKYYNFLDLDNFLSYLPERKQEKIEKKKSRKSKKGKELNISYLIAAHDVIKADDGYIFVGEAFYATYRTETTTTYVNGQAQTRTVTVFDGFQYTHAVIAKFSNDGDLIWDHTFDLDPGYKPYSRKKFISLTQADDGSLKMAYGSRNKVVIKSFDLENGEVIIDVESSEIELTLEGDKSKEKRAFSRVTHWYDDYFIAHGSQKIKNKEEGKRKVYFISKIKFNH